MLSKKNNPAEMELHQRFNIRGKSRIGIYSIRELIGSHAMGVSQDHAQALSWLQRGLDENDVWSMRNLAEAYKTGQLGMPIDLARSQQLTEQIGRVNKNFESNNKKTQGN